MLLIQRFSLEIKYVQRKGFCYTPGINGLTIAWHEARPVILTIAMPQWKCWVLFTDFLEEMNSMFDQINNALKIKN